MIENWQLLKMIHLVLLGKTIRRHATLLNILIFAIHITDE